MENTYKVRIKFSKHGALKYIGHLDIMRFFQKTIRRSGIDIAYSTGFSPHQILSFAQPLGVGLESEGEYFDIEMYTYPGDEVVVDALNKASVPEIRILSSRVLPEKTKNAMSSVAAADYRIVFREGLEPAFEVKAMIKQLLDKDEIIIIKEGKNGPREVNIRPGIVEFREEDDGSLYLLVDASSSGNIKPMQVISSLYKEAKEPLPGFNVDITRLDTYRFKEGQISLSSENIESL